MFGKIVSKCEELKLLVFIVASFIGVIAIGPLFDAAAAMGLNAATATSVYFALNTVAWGAAVTSIVASFGLASIGAFTIWAAVKRFTLKRFIKW
ncbi:MAG TPA: hypothetical protein K8V85_10950 [Staphylococcus kloosii]|uniref:Circular bacteriocin, circularin A/uberolysin family n=1 Tax=Staphylococcus kloosii TaxID=29384 RepID=A0A921H1C9_9STAP|nr:hypothetical protein [Staphylococcus kloosii]HJF68820.1 hypothetical protein [Staphylococcus kloosii]